MKKILAVLLSLLMLMMSMAVYATEAEHVHDGCCGEVEVAAVVPEDEIVPMAELCSNCGTGTLTKKYSSTTNIQSRPCQHTAGGYDTWQIVDYYYYYACSNSSCSNSSSSGTTHYSYNTVSTIISCGNGYPIN